MNSTECTRQLLVYAGSAHGTRLERALQIGSGYMQQFLKTAVKECDGRKLYEKLP